MCGLQFTGLYQTHKNYRFPAVFQININERLAVEYHLPAFLRTYQTLIKASVFVCACNYWCMKACLHALYLFVFLLFFWWRNGFTYNYIYLAQTNAEIKIMSAKQSLWANEGHHVNSSSHGALHPLRKLTAQAVPFVH